VQEDPPKTVAHGRPDGSCIFEHAQKGTALGIRVGKLRHLRVDRRAADEVLRTTSEQFDVASGPAALLGSEFRLSV
jgi:hypothetical protein